MGDSLAAVNAAYVEFEAKYPEAANYFCFLAGFNAGHSDAGDEFQNPQNGEHGKEHT